MTRAITSDELVLMRGGNQWSRAWLGVFVPSVIFTARLNGAPAKNDLVSQLAYDGASGTAGDVRADMTLLVGSAAGLADLGVCRVRKGISAGTG